MIHDSGIWRYLPQKPPLNWVAPKERVLALAQVYTQVVLPYIEQQNLR